MLRVAAPFDLTRQVPSLVTSFAKRHPAVVLDVRLSNRTLDMVDEGIDVYVRIANALDRDSVARRLAITHHAVWGAPSYLRKHGRPRTPAELAQHRFAVFDEPPLLDEHVLERDKKRTRVKLRPALLSNSGAVLVEAVVGGAALGVLPSFLLPERASGLEPVLLDWSIGSRGVYAVYPHRRFVPSKVALFVDALRGALGDPRSDPWWPAGVPLPGSAGARR